VALSEGKNRELRRFFAHFGAEVVDLKRISFAEIELNNLPEGKVRFLSRSEYSALAKFLKDEKKSEQKEQRSSEKRVFKKDKSKNFAKDDKKPATKSKKPIKKKR
jgi:23S rRNA pseudouridine2605 synthase